ncbi:MAG: DNA cytosine methyltransferase [Cyanobacteria bacterium SZAS LIN-2]|nr:DNA cytosine methyltransferase [Cyanobacteria bacterium SZAS LIN-2]
MTIQALEFYSGIGAFARAAAGFNIDVVEAFDQNQWANLTYEANFGHKPCSRNLDSIPEQGIPESDLWWMSPPCTPFSRRGKQKDGEDNRARSFLHLIDFMTIKKPRHILVENVSAFIGSNVHGLLLARLNQAGYRTAEYQLCSSMFGVPMLRPRVFIVATLDKDVAFSPAPPQKTEPAGLIDYLFESDDSLNCSPEILSRYEAVLNIVDPKKSGSYLICFTSGYQRCRQASGSLIREDNGTTRFVSPAEILGLLGFGGDYRIPQSIPQAVAYKLVGNSVDVRAIKYLLSEVLQLR